jgi:hypothetical protein
MTLSIAMLCYNVECHYAECRILFTIILNAIILSVVVLNVVMLNVAMLSVVALLWSQQALVIASLNKDKFLKPFFFVTHCRAK